MTAVPPPEPPDERVAALEREVAALKGGGITGKLLKYLPWMAAGHLLIGAPALLISLIVAYGTFEQADATRNIQRATAWPFIAFGTSNAGAAGSRDVTLMLTNQGVGPAIMSTIELRYRGQPMRSTAEFFERCCGVGPDSRISYSTGTISGVVIRPGEEVRFISVPDNPVNDTFRRRLESERWRVSVRACYCSVFDECWTIAGRQSKPRPVEQCPANWVPFRER